ncbi:unnamed protein product [Cunninghamella echinulata]
MNSTSTLHTYQHVKQESKQKTPTSTSSFYSTENKTQSKKYNGDLKGPRLPSKYNTYSDNRSQQTIPSSTSFDNDDNVLTGTIRSYQSEPDIVNNNNNTQTTIKAMEANNSISNVYNNLINSMDNINIYDIENDIGDQPSSKPLYNSHNSDNNDNNEKNKDDQTNQGQRQTKGNMGYKNKSEYDVSQSSTTTTRHDNQQTNSNNDNRNYGDSSNNTQQYKENTYTSNNDKPPIPTFCFGSNDTATNKKNEMPPIPTFSFNNNTHSTNNMPPIPTFSFGDDNDQDNGGEDEIPIDLSVSLRCGACDELINGMAITAAGHRWHTECFKCYHCKQDLEHIAFYVKDQLPYCALDYHELFTTRCDYCHTPIEDVKIIIINWTGSFLKKLIKNKIKLR